MPPAIRNDTVAALGVVDGGGCGPHDGVLLHREPGPGRAAATFNTGPASLSRDRHLGRRSQAMELSAICLRSLPADTE